MEQYHGTTILSVRRGKHVAMGGDGQVTVGNSIMKADAVKIRRLMDDRVVVGFAGASADAFALLERFEGQLKEFKAERKELEDQGKRVARLDEELKRSEAEREAVRGRIEALIAQIDQLGI